MHANEPRPTGSREGRARRQPRRLPPRQRLWRGASAAALPHLVLGQVAGVGVVAPVAVLPTGGRARAGAKQAGAGRRVSRAKRKEAQQAKQLATPGRPRQQPVQVPGCLRLCLPWPSAGARVPAPAMAQPAPAVAQSQHSPGIVRHQQQGVHHQAHAVVHRLALRERLVPALVADHPAAGGHGARKEPAAGGEAQGRRRSLVWSGAAPRYALQPIRPTPSLLSTDPN